MWNVQRGHGKIKRQAFGSCGNQRLKACNTHTHTESHTHAYAWGKAQKRGQR